MKKLYNKMIINPMIYNIWKKIPINKKKNNTSKTFSIIMPPPNITGNLHIGHAYQQTIMDIIIRYKKMSGYKTLWIMGSDHAGIATQTLVEKKIKKKYSIYTKSFLIKKLWKWKKKYEKKILAQTKLLGSYINWNHIYFTLDSKFNYAVKTAFIILYKNKLIYQNKKIVYWDTQWQTVISDSEIILQKKQITQWNLTLPIFNKDNNKYITHILIKLTKPEYLLGSTAIIIKKKYYLHKNINNTYCINPLTNFSIPIILDDIISEHSQKNWSSILITPSHHINSYKYAIKHKLQFINIYHKNGFIKKYMSIYNYLGIKYNQKINNDIHPIHNIHYLKARKKIINILLYKKIILYKQNIKKTILYSNKSNTEIINLWQKQWFIKTKILAKNTLNIIKKKKILLYPINKYEKLYYSWLYNNQDWCISRQIIWGHKIPIWYDNNKIPYTGYNITEISKKYNIPQTQLKQDKNTLDTWFSSALWILTITGWPKKKINNYPIDLIVSGFDIIYYWIIRMIMLSTYLSKNTISIPFKKVYITGLINDENNQKMSKSLGNVIDPKDIIYGISLNKLIKKRTKNIINDNIKKNIINNTKKHFPHGIFPYGVDTLRLTLTKISIPNKNITFNIQHLNNSNYFYNKIWNIHKYLIHIVKKKEYYWIKKNINYKKLSIINQWIIYNYNKLLYFYKINMHNLRLDLIYHYLFHFIIHIFCDWYIEFTKKIFFYQKKEYKKTLYILFWLTQNILKLLHPIIPFITEYLWSKIQKFHIYNKKTILLEQSLPTYNNKKLYPNNFYIISIIQKIILYLRKKLLKTKNNYILIIFNVQKSYIKNLKKYLFLIKNKNIKKITILDNIKSNNYQKIKTLIKNIYIILKKIK